LGDVRRRWATLGEKMKALKKRCGKKGQPKRKGRVGSGGARREQPMVHKLLGKKRQTFKEEDCQKWGEGGTFERGTENG